MSSFNLLLACDNTSSMGESLHAIKKSIYEFYVNAKLLNIDIQLASIGDYDLNSCNKGKEGGYTYLSNTDSFFETKLYLDTNFIPQGGGGTPEAFKTLLNKIIRLKPLPNVVFLFCDAPPHGVHYHLDNEGYIENYFLDKNEYMKDWDLICTVFKKAGIKVITFLTNYYDSFYIHWAKLGNVIGVKDNNSTLISKLIFSTFYKLIDYPQRFNYLDYCIYYDEIKVIKKINIPEIIQNIDPSFVLKIFSLFLDKYEPIRVLGLTTNEILGKFWRLICGKYKYIDNKKYEDECNNIMNTFSYIMNSNKLNIGEKEQLKEWLNNSYDNSYETNNIIRKYIIDDVQEIIYLNQISELSVDNIKDIGRSCRYQIISDLLGNIEMEKRKIEKINDIDHMYNFLPLNLDNETLFKLLGHLLKPGITFNRIESFMIAILCLNNKFLGLKAHEYLKDNCGKWIDWSLNEEKKPDHPMFWSFNFISLLRLTNDINILTQKEIDFRDHFLLVNNCYKNKDSLIEITLPLMLKSKKLEMKTWKRHCERCNRKVCFTLFTDNICAICNLNYEINEVQKYIDKGMKKDINNTNWVQCRICKVNYSVILTENLNVEPKCHYCRFRLKKNQLIPKISCYQCCNTFLNTNNSAHIALNEALQNEIPDSNEYKKIQEAIYQDKFICPLCVYSKNNQMEIELRISELIEENDIIKNMIPISNYNILISKYDKLWFKVLICTKNEKLELNNIVLTYEKYIIHNPLTVLEKINKILCNNDGLFTCNMCVEELPNEYLISPCGYCRNFICKSCVSNWYSQVSIGQLVMNSHCCCPFCKSVPKYKIIKNFDISQIKNLPITNNRKNIIQWKHNELYGLCKKCFHLKYALDKDCARNEMPNIKDFICEECMDIHVKSVFENALDASLLDIKKCPSCQMDTTKVSGCNHIICPSCQCHWCWVCCSYQGENNVPFNNNTIYDHMSNCGGIFPTIMNEQEDFVDNFDY